MCKLTKALLCSFFIIMWAQMHPQADAALNNPISDSQIATTHGPDLRPLISAIVGMGSAEPTANGEHLVPSSVAITQLSTDREVPTTVGPDLGALISAIVAVGASETTSNDVFLIEPGITATRTSNFLVVGGATLSPGGAELTTGENTISLGSSGIIGINNQTTSLPPLIPSAPQTTSDTPLGAVTSIMSSAPSDVSTQVIHPPGVSTNTWITTSRNGEPTMLPGIWCSECGPDGNGGIVVIWNFPKLKLTEFDWPQFPGLPRFQLPCIGIFGVPVTECPPPQSNEQTSDEDKGTGR